MHDQSLHLQWIEQLVDALYRMVLLREPDAVGRQQNIDHFAAHIEAGGRIEDMLQAFLTSEEFGRTLPAFVGRYSTAAATRFTLDQSQHGEVELLLRLMVNQGATHRIVVDVGANGRARSNSYDLLRHFGWKGLLVEANPLLEDSIRRDFDGLDFELVNAAISNHTGVATFYIGVNNDVSSLTENNARHWGETRGEVEVSVRPLSPLLTEHAIPNDFDLLSIDAEGEDIVILNETIEAGYRPRWVVIEASYGFTTRDLNGLPFSALVRETYRMVAQTQANLILGLAADAHLVVQDDEVLKLTR